MGANFSSQLLADITTTIYEASYPFKENQHAQHHTESEAPEWKSAFINKTIPVFDLHNHAELAHWGHFSSSLL